MKHLSMPYYATYQIVKIMRRRLLSSFPLILTFSDIADANLFCSNCLYHHAYLFQNKQRQTTINKDKDNNGPKAYFPIMENARYS